MWTRRARLKLEAGSNLSACRLRSSLTIPPPSTPSERPDDSGTRRLRWVSSSVFFPWVAVSTGRTRRSRTPPTHESMQKVGYFPSEGPRIRTRAQTVCYAHPRPSSLLCPRLTTLLFLLFVRTFMIISRQQTNITVANSVQDLLNTPSLSPSPSLVTVATTPGLPRSGTPGLQRSGTYVVKVHSRTTHSRTEFPRANPPISPTKPGRKQPPPLGHSTDTELDSCSNHDEEDEDRQPRLKEVNFTPKDTSRLYRLRRDPSVASLLNLYDDRGCLDSAIFENSPPTPAPISAFQEGREPNKRSGSTLRQLLGATETAFFNNTAEGDISWAERFLE